MEHTAFLEQLSDYGARARAALLDRLPEGQPDVHLYGAIRDYVRRSGKGVRPALMLATCGAFGGRPDHALTSAAALELLHNAFLIHDDIEDESEFRRGVPCLHRRLGVPLAINAGDAMQALALRMLRNNVDPLGPATAARVLDEFDHLLMRSLEGQAMELGWIRDNEMGVRPVDYLRMTLRKTCWYSFIHPCRIGALIAAPDRDDLSAFDAFGFYLGAAFQIQDDLLNLTGSQRTYGKEILGDVYEGKRTLMLARLAEQAAPDELERLTRFLATPRAGRDPKDAVWVVAAMDRHGCVDYGRVAAADLAEAARGAFAHAFAHAGGEDRAFVARLLDYMVEREV